MICPLAIRVFVSLRNSFRDRRVESFDGKRYHRSREEKYFLGIGSACCLVFSVVGQKFDSTGETRRFDNPVESLR